MTSLLARATARKAIDQGEQVGLADTHYIPLEELRTWTGLGISEQSALNYIAVYQCVRVLSNFFAQLPLKVYRRRTDGGKEEAVDHPLYRVLHLEPNPAMTSFVWRKLVMQHLATWGNHYSEISRDVLGRLQLWPIRPDRIEVRWGSNGLREYHYLSSVGGRKKLAPGSIFHMQGQTSNGLVGSSPIAELRSTLSLARAAERYGTALFDNNARPAVVLQHPRHLSEGAIERLAGQMDDLRGARNAGKTVVLEEGLQVTPIGFPPEDAEFLQTRLTQHRLIYGAYGVPPHKVADLERATFSNIEHSALEFIQDGGLPWLVNAEQEFAVQLIEDDDVFAEFLVDGYLRGDAKTRAEALAIRWQHASLSPNEWRQMENENPVEGGDVFYAPVNYAPVNYAPVGTSPPSLAEAPASSTRSAFVRCSSCQSKLAEAAGPGTVITCRHCKTVNEIGTPALLED